MRFAKSIFIVSIFALLLPSLAGAFPAEVPRTGQAICYNAGGDIITCANTGQDGAIRAGVVWPDPRFTDRVDGTVSDNLTGLVWTKNANLPNGAVTWQNALNYVAGMNAGTYSNFGHTDWRLPNVNELESLVHSGMVDPSLPQNPFLNVQSFYYWSSTSCEFDTLSAWSVGMSNRLVYFDYKSNSTYFVWPVRSGQCGALGNSVICLPKTGQTTCYDTAGDNITCTGTRHDGDIQAGVAWPDPRFIDNGDNTTTCNLTGLVWAKNANLMVTRDTTFDADDTANDGKVTWQHALDYVAKLNSENYLNHTDWRLPNIRELRSLADYSRYNPAFSAEHLLSFSNVQPNYYWSSTTYRGGPGYAWVVGMYNGYGTSFEKTTQYFVWPVCSGQVVNLVTSTTTTVVPTTTSVFSSTTTSTGGVSTTTSIGAATTTTTTGGGKPCPATQLLGAGNQNLENLRDFRDSRLAQSAVGRKVTQIYYNNADSINAALENSPALRAAARSVLEVIAPIMGRE